MLRNFVRSEILNPRQFVNAKCPWKFKPIRNSSIQERCETSCLPPPECPPNTRCLMDLYSIPCGSWKEDYDAKNVIYNRQLMVAAVVLFVTSFTVYRVGWVNGYPEITFF